MGKQNLGELGVVHDDIELSFTYFGAEIRVNTNAGQLSYLEFMAQAAALDEKDQIQSMPLLMKFLREQIHDDDWEVFFGLAKKHRQTMDDLMGVSNAILEAISDFPTTPQSDFSSGLPPIEQKSKVVSSSPATQETAADRAMKLLAGRPDLQAAVVRVQETSPAG